MNTPNVQTVMPGDSYDGSDPSGALTRDQFVTLLEDFARRNALPIETGTAVSELAHENDAYRLTTSRGTLLARNVIVASGSLNCPVRPAWAASLPPVVRQIDASDYRRLRISPMGRCWSSEAASRVSRSRRSWRKRDEQSSLPPVVSDGSPVATEAATSWSGFSNADFLTCDGRRSFDLQDASLLVACLGRCTR
jgi:putative flavoprotein involved in K+ transport